MTPTLNETTPTPADILDRLIAEHGAWKVAIALAARPFRRRGPPLARDLSMLPGHIRRDIGLPEPPHAEPPHAELPPPGLAMPLRGPGLGQAGAGQTGIGSITCGSRTRVPGETPAASTEASCASTGKVR